MKEHVQVRVRFIGKCNTLEQMMGEKNYMGPARRRKKGPKRCKDPQYSINRITKRDRMTTRRVKARRSTKDTMGNYSSSNTGKKNCHLAEEPSGVAEGGRRGGDPPLAKLLWGRHYALCCRQWRTQKISEGGQVSSQSCDVIN